MSLPLDGIRVLELGHIVAGPSAGLILADLGADVIKVEATRFGDQGRTSMQYAFPFFNRNKRSLSIDLKSIRGKEIFEQLASTADIVIDNYSPGVVERLGISYGHLTTENPGLIYLSIKGFLEGPYGERPFLDELAQMMGGLAYMTGPVGQPLRAGASIIDVGAATYGVIGIFAALFERARSGRGQMITSGLFETSVFWVGQWMARAASTKQPSMPMAERDRGMRTGWAVYQLFNCADGVQIFVGITSDVQWNRFCGLFDLTDLEGDGRLATNAARVDEIEWLIPRIESVLRRYTATELTEKLERSGIPFAPVLRPDELLQHEHLVESIQLMSVPLPHVGTGPVPKLPYRSESYGFHLRRPAPGLGEHTNEILEELGITGSTLNDLLADGVVTLGESLEHDWIESER